MSDEMLICPMCFETFDSKDIKDFLDHMKSNHSFEWDNNARVFKANGVILKVDYLNMPLK